MAKEYPLLTVSTMDLGSKIKSKRDLYDLLDQHCKILLLVTT